MNATFADGVSHRSGDPLFMTSLARGLHVFRALLEAGGRQTIAELSRATGLHRAVVRRCLYTLGELGYACKDGRTYRLGPQIATLEQLPAQAAPIARAARPVLDGLSRRLGERSALAALADGKVVYLVCATPDGLIGAPSTQRQPALYTAAGRVLLACLPQRQAVFELSRMERGSRAGLTAPAWRELTEALSQVRARGYALVEEELEFGARAVVRPPVRTLAVPVRNILGAILGAMEVDVRTTRLPREGLIEEYLPLLKTAAVALGRGLQVPRLEASIHGGVIDGH